MHLTMSERVRTFDREPITTIGAVLGVFYLLTLNFSSPWVLTQDDYRQPVILFRTLRGLWEVSGRTITFVGVLVVLGYHWRKLLVPWSDLPSGRNARIIVGTAAGVLAWTYSTYSYNFVVESSHWVDRLLVVAFAIGIAFRPVFVFPFLVVILPIAGQFNTPFATSFAAVSLPVNLVLLMGAAILLWIVTNRDIMPAFYFLLVCVVAAHYLEPGLGKLELGWLSSDEPHYLFPNTYASGWLRPLSDGQVSGITRGLRALNPLIKLGVVVLELGVFLTLIRRRVVRVFLVGWAILQSGIALFSGIVLWQWIIVVGLLAVLELRSGLLSDRQFNLAHVVLSIAVIGSTIFWLNTTRLAWIDSPATYTYQYVAVGESGQKYSLPARAFAPHTYGLSTQSLHYLTDAATLPVGFGATNAATYELLREAKTPEELLAIEEELGSRASNESRTKAFEQFMVSFMQHQNEHLDDRWLPSWLRAPSAVWAFDAETAYDRQEPLSAIRTERFLSAFIDGEYVAFDPILVSHVQLD